ncbi:two-component sensor histidine kinase [Methylorubrum extorquens]|jgi:signal transduction histidine kinase|uniref:HAMP domain-containing sensor histidine kinase n=1 Tax=Methylorubrum extorquens TaxID=408 RepID=UPI0009727D3B|nr:HAMP domain-containing sensor histidine kinase [Methylorubrum extorquens]APX85131.1 two-component sensor histidine kinase [Methylorubrum extorquens]
MMASLLGWPGSLRGRLFLILLAGLLSAQFLSFVVTRAERDQTARAVMLTTLQRDVAVAVALLDRLPAPERSEWLPLLERPTYRFALGSGSPGIVALSSRLTMIADEIRAALEPRFPVRFDAVSGPPVRLQGHVALSDGSALTIAVQPTLRPVASWLPVALALQLLVLVGCVWFAVRLAVRPLTRFAQAADALEPGRPATRFAEAGPDEVARAARALNAMQQRVSRHLDERVRILAAISHDLQTPITRMRLRVETGVEGPEQDRILGDLEAIETLVREGIAYARSVHGDVEPPTRLDLRAFLESIAFDYQDTGRDVAVSGLPEVTIVTRPQALRRILTNLIDNAIRYADRAELDLQVVQGRITIAVLDRGPGIPADKLDAVLLPFVRLEGSRSRETGGTGLGLAIADQLAAAIGGRLRLNNRPGGGLEAAVTLS